MGFFYTSYIKRSEKQCLILKISITPQLYFLNQETSINTHGYRLYSSSERQRDCVGCFTENPQNSFIWKSNSQIHTVRWHKSEMLVVLHCHVLKVAVSKLLWTFLKLPVLKITEILNTHAKKSNLITWGSVQGHFKEFKAFFQWGYGVILRRKLISPLMDLRRIWRSNTEGNNTNSDKKKYRYRQI